MTRSLRAGFSSPLAPCGGRECLSHSGCFVWLERVSDFDTFMVMLDRRGRRYGLSGSRILSRIRRHGGLCALCQLRHAKVIDHDHATGVARGLLCAACNGAVGHYERRPEEFRSLYGDPEAVAIIDYLRRGW
jgi:hypothetical protein